jgi:hypothetical protein
LFELVVSGYRMNTFQKPVLYVAHFKGYSKYTLSLRLYQLNQVRGNNQWSTNLELLQLESTYLSFQTIPK